MKKVKFESLKTSLVLSSLFLTSLSYGKVRVCLCCNYNDIVCRKKVVEFESVTQQHSLSAKTYESRIESLNRELSYYQNEAKKIKSQYDWLVNETELAKQKQVENEKAAERSQGKCSIELSICYYTNCVSILCWLIVN